MVHEFLSLVNCNIGSAFGSKIIALKDVPESRNINIFSESQGMGIVDLAFYVMYYVHIELFLELCIWYIRYIFLAIFFYVRHAGRPQPNANVIHFEIFHLTKKELINES